MFRNALVSVSDKSGLIEFIKPLADKGMRVVSTGGTAKFLEQNGIKVVHVSEQTKFPEVMDGRVRTLHPNIHMALLGRLDNPEDVALLKEHHLEPFDLVVGNLYPFEKQLEQKLDEDEMIEYIDIGGPALLRAASKNFKTITVVCDPKDYSDLLKDGSSLEKRKKLAAKVFAHISGYDSVITHYLSGGEWGHDHSLAGSLVQELRYGENPQQKAVWYRRRGAVSGLHQAAILQGKALSYNNLLDLEAAVGCLREFKNPAVVAVKHNNPCGVALGATAIEATGRALKADPVSVFGGIVAVNRELTPEITEQLNRLFLECVIAPSISLEAKKDLEKKKNLRVLIWSQMLEPSQEDEIKTISGGYLVQSQDHVTEWQSDWKIFGDSPKEEVKSDLILAWKVCRHLKSNAIAVAEKGMTLGLGMGQVNRVEAVEHALHRMETHHKGVQTPVLASDAFFPFPDSIERIASAGIKWVIQPGGSVKDQEVIECARRLKVNLIMTGERHFKH